MTASVGLIGFGAIAQDLVAILTSEAPLTSFSVLVREGREEAALSALAPCGLPGDALITADLAGFLYDPPIVVAECAGHAALERFGQPILAAGSDLVAASVGALSDAALHERLEDAARQARTQLVIPSGAIGGIDVLSAARLSGLTAVTYTGRKPPAAWAGTPAAEQFDLDGIDTPTPIFEGSAREAAQLYPKNANVAATLALAGLGLDETGVRLLADPTVSENIHEFSLASPAVEATIRLVGKPSPRNPKTSQTTALSIARAVLNRTAPVVL